MAEAATKLPVKAEEKKVGEKATAVQGWRPFENLRREVDRLFEDFDRDSGCPRSGARYSTSSRSGAAN